MDKLSKLAVAKLLYGLLFVALLPLLLVIWADKTSDVVALPAVHSLSWGLVTTGVGLLLMALGMASLWWLGGGLPMNAFPPPRYVSGGIYQVFSHPIYVGFACVCVGIAIAAGSASGLWLVSTTVIFASAALVLGYELPDLRTRFGAALPQQRLLPPDAPSQPTALERLRCYMTVLLPWLVLYKAVTAIGIPLDAKVAYFPFESQLLVWPWTEIFYVSAYVVVALVPLMVPTRHALRWFSSRALLSMLIAFPMYLVLPLIAPPRPFVLNGMLGALLNFDRAHDSAAAALPSYHVIWAFLTARVMGRKPWQSHLWQIWAVLVAASCVTTGMHALMDVLAGLLVVWLVVRMESLWSSLRNGSEAIANSWREWRIGPVRVINHGGYAAVGVFLGMWILDTLLGPGKSLIPIAIFFGGTIGAALWAQFIEGSPALLRPLGFYGGVLGTWIGGAAAAWWCGASVWQVAGALAVAAPCIQGIGRLRCLVQGCCHGRPASQHLGIRYETPHSRVCRIASLRGIPIHPTPLYSLLWNVGTFIVVIRLYLLHTTAAMVGGVYLILSGLGRFVEEAYRGEPQTPVLWGLRLYQWIALVTVFLGAAITTLVRTPRTPEPIMHPSSVLVALVCGIAAWFVSGIDFPESSRRFARLS